MSDVRRACVTVVVALGALGLLVWGDRWADTGRFETVGPWGKVFCRGLAVGKDFRLANQRSEIVIPGLWSSSRLQVAVGVSTAQSRPVTVRLIGSGGVITEGEVGRPHRLLRGGATAGTDGTLRIRFESPLPRKEWLVRVGSVQVRQARAPRIPVARWVSYSLVVLLSLVLGGLCCGSWVAAWVLTAVVAAAAGTAVVLARLQAMAALPWLVFTLLGGVLVASVSLEALGMSRSLTRWLVLGFVCRFAFAMHPAALTGDVMFHVHNIWGFADKRLITSEVAPPDEVPETRGRLPVPYPPGLYAVLAPLATREAHADEVLVRVFIGAIEGLSPLLIFVLMRAGGASVEASSMGAVTASVMPEGLLVLHKAIAANIFGSFVGLLVLIGALTASPPVVASLMSLAFLSHFGVALSLSALLLVWWVHQLARGELTRSEAAVRMGSMGLAGAIAWMAYYREVAPLLLGAGASVGGQMAARHSGLQVHWARLGEIGQDLVFKFGGAPVLLALWGLRASREASRLRGLLVAWLTTTLGMALLALFTSVILRFEYFVMPAVAAAAGLGAERLFAHGSGRWVRRAWSLALVIQVGLGIVLLTTDRRFDSFYLFLDYPRLPFF